MPKSTKYSTKRTKKYCERHEAYYSRAYRNKSIKDGLIVFLTVEVHRGTNGVHGKNGDKLNRYLKKVAQKAWMEYYKKTKEAVCLAAVLAGIFRDVQKNKRRIY